MEYLIYGGSTTMGDEYWYGFKEGFSTGDCKVYKRKIGEFYLHLARIVGNIYG